MKELVRWILLYLGLPWLTIGWLIGFVNLIEDMELSWKEIAFWTYLCHYLCWALAALVVWAFSP